MSVYRNYGSCPRCEADEGEPCRTRSGDVSSRPHTAREHVEADSSVYPGTPEDVFGELNDYTPGGSPVRKPPGFWNELDTWHRRTARKEHGSKTKLKRKINRWARWTNKIYGRDVSSVAEPRAMERLIKRYSAEHIRQELLRPEVYR